MQHTNRFYKGDIAKEIARGSQEQGGLITEQDLAYVEGEDRGADDDTIKGIDVYKLQQWTQGPALLSNTQHPRNFDLKKHGVQFNPIHSYVVSGDEPRFCRP